MGLDVGSVRITYLDRPKQPIYDFLWNVAENIWDESWGGSWEGNGFVEFERRTLMRRVRRFARERQLSNDETEAVISWARSLPWDNGTIMLHLNW